MRVFPKAAVPLPTMLAAALLAAPLRAQDTVSVTTFVPAEVLDTVEPIYPFEARTRGREGWVMVSFVIGETGEVSEPMIEDSSGSKHFEYSALKAVRQWRFKPAMRNGAPVPQSMTRTRVVFARPGGGRASRNFLRAYNQINQLLRKNELAAASKRIDGLELAERYTLTEDAGFWWLKYQYLESAGSSDDAAMIDALQHALGYEGDYLPPGLFVAAAQILYDKYARVGDLSSAVRTLARLKKSQRARLSKSYEQTVAQLETANLRIEATVASDETLRMNGRIAEHEYWVHDLLRRSFSVADVQGEIEAIDIRCEKGTRRYTALRPDFTWTIPPTWGACGVYVRGEVGTSFAFEEYPAARAPEHAIDPAAADERR